MKPTQRLSHTQHGMTLMETLLVLSIVSFIIVGGLTLYGSASVSARAQRGQQQLLGLASNIRGLFTSTGNYTQLDSSGEQLLEDASAVPDDMTGGVDDGTILNVWNGNVTVSSGVGTVCSGVLNSLNTANTFCLQFTNVEEESCIKLLSNATVIGFEQAQAGSGAFRGVNALSGDIAQIAVDCKTGAGGRVTMRFLFL